MPQLCCSFPLCQRCTFYLRRNAPTWLWNDTHSREHRADTNSNKKPNVELSPRWPKPEWASWKASIEHYGYHKVFKHTEHSFCSMGHLVRKLTNWRKVKVGSPPWSMSISPFSGVNRSCLSLSHLDLTFSVRSRWTVLSRKMNKYEDSSRSNGCLTWIPLKKVKIWHCFFSTKETL